MAFAAPSNGASSSAVPARQQQAGASQQQVQPEMDVSLRAHIPFFNPVELEHMSAKARGKMSENVVAQRTAAACGFIEALGARMGFPQRTICAAQMLYQRFHLYFPVSDFVSQEVALAALSMSGKMNDTYKRGRDVLLASYAIRYPELVKNPPAAASQRASVHVAQVSEGDVDAAALENERKRQMALEKLFLECISFNFQTSPPCALSTVIKLGRLWGLTKEDCQLAWRAASDAHRTTAVLMYPSKIISAASVYLASELTCQAADYITLHADSEALNQRATAIISKIRRPTQHSDADAGEVADEVQSALNLDLQAIEEAAHLILDSYYESATMIKSTFGSLFSASPRSPFDLPLSSSDSDGLGSGMTTGQKRAELKWSNSPPPLLITWLVEKLAESNKGPSELLALLTDVRVRMRQRVDEAQAADKDAGEDEAQGATKPEEGDGDVQQAIKARLNEARQELRTEPDAKADLAEMDPHASGATPNADAPQATMSGEATPTNAIGSSSEKKMSLKRYWFELGR